MNPTRVHNFDDVRSALEARGHGYLFAHWDRRSPAQRQRLGESLAELDLAHLERLQTVLRNASAAGAAGAAPAPIEPAPVRIPSAADAERWTERGGEMLSRGACALLTVAGGQGTRLGFEAPKGLFPVTPIRSATLFQVFAEKLLAACSEFAAAIPWFIMTSPLNHAATARFFAEQDYFGLPERDVRLFRQGANPVLSDDGRLLLAPDGGLLTSPDGAGGVLTALQRSGLGAEAARRGIDYLFYFQVDNPLATVPDPAFLGAHLETGSRFSTKVVEKLNAAEKVGVAALVAGKPGIVEYSDIDPALAVARSPSGDLTFRFGSIGFHLIDTTFASEQAAALPIHLAHKKEPVLFPERPDAGPQPREVVKFEQFVFDVIPLAEPSMFYAVDRGAEFAPLKNRSGPDSIDTCRAGQIALARRWLELCGVAVAEFAADGEPLRLEITPRYAAHLAALQHRLPPAVTRIDDHTLLDC